MARFTVDLIYSSLPCQQVKRAVKRCHCMLRPPARPWQVHGHNCLSGGVALSVKGHTPCVNFREITPLSAQLV
jgi:hypothetical protein